MTQSNRKTMLRSIVEAQGRKKPVEPIQFPGDLILTYPELIQVSIGGFWHRIPPHTAAIIHNSSSQSQVQYRDHYLPPGENCLVQYVDLRQRPLIFKVAGPTNDGWWVQLDAKILFSVSNPRNIVQLKDPLGTLRMAVGAAMKSIIQNYPHDELIPNIFSQLRVDGDLVRAIRANFNKTPIAQCFRLDGIVITGRQGDSRRAHAIQQAIVEQANINTELMVQQQRIYQREQILRQETDLARLEKLHAIQTASVERARIEEQEKLGLTLADYHARKAAIMLPAQEQDLRLRQLEQAQTQAHERNMHNIDAQKTIFSSMAEAVTQIMAIPGWQRGLNPEASDMLVQIMRDYNHSVNGGDAAAENLTGVHSAQRPSNFSPPLLTDLEDLRKVTHITIESFQPETEGLWRLSVTYRHFNIQVWLDEMYPESVPSRITVRVGERQVDLTHEIVFRPGMTMKDVIQLVINWFMGGAYKSQEGAIVAH